MKLRIMNLDFGFKKAFVLLLIAYSLLFTSCFAQIRPPRLTDWDGTSKDSWQIGKAGDKIKFSADSSIYYIRFWNSSISAWDSLQFIGSKNPRGNNVWQDIVGRKWFKTILQSDTLYTKHLKLIDGATDIATMGSGEIRISNGSYPNYISWILYYGQNGLGGRSLDSLAHLRYMRTSGEAKYLTGLRPSAPTDTGKALFFGSGGVWSLRTIAASHAAVTETITGIDLTGQALSLTAGYSIPQDTSIANWRTAYAMRHSAITESITGISLTGQALSLTAGYVIPTTTQETNWNSAYSASHSAVTETIAAIDLTGQALSLASGYYIPTTTDQTNWNNKVIAPASNTADYIPLWNGANSKTLKDGLAYTSAATASTIVGRDGSAHSAFNAITLGSSSQYGQFTIYGTVKNTLITTQAASTDKWIELPNASGTVALTSDLTNMTIAPATNTADYIPLWNGANSKTLKNGLQYTSAATASTIVGRDGSAHSAFNAITLGSSSQYGQFTIYGTVKNTLVTTQAASTDKWIELPNASGTVALTSDLTYMTIAPASNTADNIPLWNGANSKTLKDGLAYTSAATASTIVGRDGSAHSAFNAITLGSSSQYGQLTIYGTTYNTLITTNAASSNKWIQFPNSDGDVPLLQTANNFTGINEFRSDLKFTDDLVNVWETATVSGDTLYTTGKTSMTTDYDGDIRVIAGGVEGKEILLMSTGAITSMTETGNIVNLPSGYLGFNQYGTARFKYYASAGKWVCISVENN